MLVVANQIAPAGGNKRFAHELVVLGLAVLDKRALHRFFVRIARHVDRFHGAWVHAGVVHAGGHRGRRGVEVLHLLGHIAHVAYSAGEFHGLFHGRTGM